MVQVARVWDCGALWRPLRAGGSGQGRRSASALSIALCICLLRRAVAEFHPPFTPLLPATRCVFKPRRHVQVSSLQPYSGSATLQASIVDGLVLESLPLGSLLL